MLLAHGMTVNGKGERTTSFCETLPSNSPATRPAPRLPTTMASAFISCAISMIVCAASPVRDFEQYRADAGFSRAISRRRQRLSRLRLQHLFQPNLLVMSERHEYFVRQPVAAYDIDNQKLRAIGLGPARGIINRAICALGPVRRHQNTVHCPTSVCCLMTYLVFCLRSVTNVEELEAFGLRQARGVRPGVLPRLRLRVPRSRS